jgi:putative heme-binding domain-containing protein
MILKSQGGISQIVAKEKIASKKRMDRSLMISASGLGMTAQDIADVIAYLKK